jgi:hypothetical protein
MMDIRAGGSKLDINLDDWGWEGVCHVQMIVIQRCSHHLCLRKKVDDKGDDCDEDNKHETCVDVLLLVPQHGCDNVFQKVELFGARGRHTVAKVLKEHKAAESKIITLI